MIIEFVVGFVIMFLLALLIILITKPNLILRNCSAFLFTKGEIDYPKSKTIYSVDNAEECCRACANDVENCDGFTYAQVPKMCHFRKKKNPNDILKIKSSKLQYYSRIFP